MAHIYGHNWPIRWGEEGQLRDVLVYSNCDRAELFLNGISQGTRARDSQNFPAAGLRWSVAFVPGQNHLRVEAHKAGVKVADEISLTYQTMPWGKPAILRLTERERDGDRFTAEARLYDEQGVLCLDSRNVIRFSLTGPGRLIDNLGTTRASRELQLANGRAEISFNASGTCLITVKGKGLPEAMLTVHTS
jgi:beta-galactosidase